MESSEDDKKGFKTKYRKNSTRSILKLPIFCPYEKCRRLTSSPLDDESLRNYGVCLECFTLYVDMREKPLLDIEFYRKRLQERGY